MPACVMFGHSPCGGRLQNHHLVPQQRLKRRHATLKAEERRGGPKPWPLSRALKDQRLIVDICAHHHINLVEQRRLYVDPRDVPAGAMDAVREYGLSGYLKGTPLEDLPLPGPSNGEVLDGDHGQSSAA